MSRRLLPLLLALAACDGPEAPSPGVVMTEQHLDPAACAECHPKHHEEWSGSMHAYASHDPVFLAMNRRGQRETDGALGDFCVNCHAPMAVRTGATTDGLNLESLPDHLRGVTCFFCHNTESVEGTHNNPLTLAMDGIMRGGLSNPVENGFHGSAYSPLLDRNVLGSSQTCGACHDIVVPDHDVHLERTFAEWQGSLFGRPDAEAPTSCGGCHMQGRDDVAADFPGVPIRRTHSHMMAGVDVAVTPWPQQEAQRARVQQELDTTVLTNVCVYPEADATQLIVTIENVAAGHAFPSGASQDRRLWLEITAWSGDEKVWESGVVADDEPLDLDDPDLIWFGDRIYDCEGNEVHMFWEACQVESNLLPVATTFDPLDPEYVDHVVDKIVLVPGPPITRISLRARLRPMSLEVLNDLVGSGDLDPAVRDAMPTWTLGASVIEWDEALGETCAWPP